MWCVFNLILLTAALLVAFEQPQLRAAHRLPRRLAITIHGPDGSWSGETINVSETGALIALETWPNLPDEVEVELVGDYSARAFLNGQIVWKTLVNGTKTHLAINFTNLTQAQRDSIALVIYSDVEEWYSQKRDVVDNPLGSFLFLATSLFRALREFQPYKGGKVRKQVRAAAQIYWEGNFYPGEVTEVGVTSLRLELDGSTISREQILQPNDYQRMQHDKPLVGLLFSQETAKLISQRFLAQIAEVEVLSNQNSPQGKVALELMFPEQFQERQSGKIKQLVKILQ